MGAFTYLETFNNHSGRRIFSGFWHPVFRWLHQRTHNGLEAAGAVVRIGARRVYIDVAGFERWLESQNAKAAA